MEDGVKLLLKHLFREDGVIWIPVDADCDGFTSAAILLNYLHDWVPTIVENKIKYGFHAGKEHGIDTNQLPPQTTLVIAPDSSSDEGEIHTQLHEQGIDVLVIDHHLADSDSPHAVIINNQLCDYPTKSLSGAGMVYKFCQYIDSVAGLNNADNYLDLVMLGLTADMMDVRDIETHYLIEQGLSRIVNPFISALIERNSYSIGKTVTPIGIAFYVAPYVNAMNRSGTIEEKQLLFDSMLSWKAYENIPSTKRGTFGAFEQRVEQAVRTCVNVKNRQTKAQDTTLESLEKQIQDQHLLDSKVLLILVDDIDKNLAGLVANKFMAKYQRPTAILRRTVHEGEPAWEGSARGYDASPLKDFRKFCKDSQLPFVCAGHENAFGLSLYDRDIEAFKAYCEEQLKDIEFSPNYKVDFIFQSNNFKASDIAKIGDMKMLWGQNLKEALVAIEHVCITKDNLNFYKKEKSSTLKITLPNGVACIKFKSNEDEYEQLYSDSGCVVINLVGTCDLNEFPPGRITPQIKIEDYDIISREAYYF